MSRAFERYKEKISSCKIIYRTINMFWLLLFANKEYVSKRAQYYDMKEGYLYEWQMKFINFIKNRKDTWALEAERTINPSRLNDEGESA